MVISRERLTVGASAVAPTVPSNARAIWMQADGGHVRYTLTAEDPTSTTGHRLISGLAPEKISIPDFDLASLRFISESGTVHVEITYIG